MLLNHMDKRHTPSIQLVTWFDLTLILCCHSHSLRISSTQNQNHYAKLVDHYWEFYAQYLIYLINPLHHLCSYLATHNPDSVQKSESWVWNYNSLISFLSRSKSDPLKKTGLFLAYHLHCYLLKHWTKISTLWGILLKSHYHNQLWENCGLSVESSPKLFHPFNLRHGQNQLMSLAEIIRWPLSLVKFVCQFPLVHPKNLPLWSTHPMKFEA